MKILFTHRAHDGHWKRLAGNPPQLQSERFHHILGFRSHAVSEIIVERKRRQKQLYEFFPLINHRTYQFHGNYFSLIQISPSLLSETNVKKATTSVSATAATVKMTNNNSSTIMKGMTKLKIILRSSRVAHFFCAQYAGVDKGRRLYFELQSLSVPSVYHEVILKKLTLITIL